MHSLLSASLLLTFVLTLSRLSGFARETMMAARFGITERGDAAILLVSLPDLLVGFFLVGGFNAAVVPALKRMPDEERAAFVRVLGIWCIAIFSLLAALIYWNSDIFVTALAAKLDTDSVKNFDASFTIALIALPFAAVIGLLSSYLNSISRFSVPGISVLIFNLVICTYIITYRFELDPILGFAIAVLLAVILRLVFQTLFLPKSFWLGLTKPAPRVPSFGGKFAKGVLGYGIIIFIPILFRSIFASQSDGNLALFNYAIKLFDLPAAILVAPLAVVVLPFIAKQKENAFEVRRTALIVILAALALSATIASLGQFSADLVVHTIYFRGAIQNEQIGIIASLTRWFWIGLPAYAIVVVGSATLNATDRQSQFLYSTFCALALAIGLFFTLQYWGEPLAAVWSLVGFYWFLAAIVLFLVFGLTPPSKETTIKLGLMTLTLGLLCICYVWVKPLNLTFPLVGQLAILFGFAGLALAANKRIFLDVRSLRETNA